MAERARREESASAGAALRPFRADAFVAALPTKRCTAIAVLDRTKEPGALGEPLYLDVVTRSRRRSPPAGRQCPSDRRPLRPVVQGFRSGDGQGGVRRTAQAEPKHGFTVGIVDDVSHTSLAWIRFRHRIAGRRTRAVLRPRRGRHGGCEQELGQDLAADRTEYAQGYFVYDSKKSGSLTISHLRFGPSRACALPAQVGKLRRRAQVRLPVQAGCAGGCGTGRNRSSQQSRTARTTFGTKCRAGSEPIVDKKLKLFVDRCLRR